MLAVRAPVPAATALLVLWVADATLRARRVHPVVVLICAATGFMTCLHLLPGRPEVPQWFDSGRRVEVRAVVDSVRAKPDMRLQMILREVEVRNKDNGTFRPLSGKLAWTWKYPRLRPQAGQPVTLFMRVRPVVGFKNPGLWDYEAYWQNQSVFWLGWTYGKKGVQLGAAPDSAIETLRKALRAPVLAGIGRTQGGAMVLNLLTGDRTHISPHTLDMVRSAGLAHILALSGLHVGYVALMGLLLAWVVGLVRPELYLHIPRPKLAVLFAMPLVFVYAVLGQPSASLTRAAIMFGCWGALLLVGRGRALIDGLFVALAVIILHTPLSVFDTGLRMSASAVAGIALLYPVFRRCIAVRGTGSVRRIADSLAALLCLSLAANVALLPVMAVSFGSISPNILMNLLWVPVVGLAVMPIGIGGMLLGLIPGLLDAGVCLVGISSRIADGLLWLLEWFHAAGLDPMLAVLRPLWPEVLGFAVLLATALSVRPRLWLGALGAVLILAPHAHVMALDSTNAVRLEMLDVGQGQSLLVTAPGGRRVLIDGGGTSSRTFDIGRAVVGPYLTFGRPPRVETVIMTHADNDHMGGLAWIMERFDVQRFCGNGDQPDGVAGTRIVRAAARRGISRQPLAKGDVLRLGAGVSLDVLHPGEGHGDYDSNDRSLVLHLKHEGRTLALLTGDVEKRAVHDLLAAGEDVRAQVLVLPHHGSGRSAPEALVPAVGPDFGMISCRLDNRYGFPQRNVLEALRSEGAEILRTDLSGAVRIRWSTEDGNSQIGTAVSDRKKNRMRLFLPLD